MAVSRATYSRDRGTNAELFQFIYGDGGSNVFAYANTERDVVFDGVTYAAASIEYEGLKMKGRDAGVSLRVTLDRALAICGLFQGTVPRHKVFLKVFAGDVPLAENPRGWDESYDPNQFRPIWTGVVTEAITKGPNKVLSCNTLGAGMKRPGLNRNYQRECGHRLYGPYCQANKANATRSATVAAVGADTITLDPGWAGGTDLPYFVGGTVEWASQYGTEYRQIIDIATDTLTLDSPVTELAVSDSISVIAGCPRTYAACVDLHNNGLNFGGQFGIPKNNPINKNNHT